MCASTAALLKVPATSGAGSVLGRCSQPPTRTLPQGPHTWARVTPSNIHPRAQITKEDQQLPPRSSLSEPGACLTHRCLSSVLQVLKHIRKQNRSTSSRDPCPESTIPSVSPHLLHQPLPPRHTLTKTSTRTSPERDFLTQPPAFKDRFWCPDQGENNQKALLMSQHF